MRKPVFVALAILVTSPAADSKEPSKPSDIPLEAFAQLPTMKEATLSPDGSHLAYLRSGNGRFHLVIQRLGSSDTPVVVPPLDNQDFRWIHWANDHRLVFSVSATSSQRFVETVETRLLAIDEDGSNSEYIVQPSVVKISGSHTPRKVQPAQIQDDVIDWLPQDPDHILVNLDGDHDGDSEVRKIDIDSGSFDVILDGHTGIQNWLTDLSGEIRFGWGYRNEWFRVLYRRPNGNFEEVTDSSWRDAGYFPQGFADGDNTVYVLGPDESGFTVMRTMDIETGEFLETVASGASMDIDGVLDDPLSGRTAGAVEVGDEDKYHWFDNALVALQRGVDNAQPGMVNRILSTTTDRRKVLIRSSSDTDAGVFLFLDRDKGSLDFIAEAMPGLNPDLISAVQAISYNARDGLTIPAYLTLPKSGVRENLPMIVMPHGGPESRDDKSFFFLSRFLASRGYAVFQPNFRGSSGYGRSFALAGRREWGGKMQDDVVDGTRWLIDQGIADPERICIVGWSYGGYSAAMGAVQSPNLYRCAASINGVLNLPRQIADDRKYIGGSTWTRHMGLEDITISNVSPYHQANRIEIPMLIVQSKDDARVHLDQGRQLAQRLEQQMKPVEYVEVELGGHSMMNGSAREVILRSLESFLEKNLGEH